MNIKLGDTVKLKSIAEIINEHSVIDINEDGTIYLKDSPPITKEMYKFLDGVELIVSGCNETFFASEVFCQGFFIDWIKSVEHEQGKVWEEFEDGDHCFTLYGDGVVLPCRYGCGKCGDEDYVQGNVCHKEEPLKFLSIQRGYEFKIRKFMVENNEASPTYYIESSHDSLSIENYSTILSTKWRFSTRTLARKCLDMIGEENWRIYILEAGDERK